MSAPINEPNANVRDEDVARGAAGARDAEAVRDAQATHDRHAAADQEAVQEEADDAEPLTQSRARTDRPRNLVLEVSDAFVAEHSETQLAGYVNTIVAAHSRAGAGEDELTSVLVEGFDAADVKVDEVRIRRLAEQILMDDGADLTIVTDSGRLLHGTPLQDQAHHVPGVVGTEDPASENRPLYS